MVAYQIQNRTHRKTACQYGCNRPAQSEFGRDRRDGICTLGTVEANLRRPSLALLLPVGSGYMCCDAHPPRSCAVAAVCFSRCWLVLVLWRSFFTATATGTMKTPIASTKNNPSSQAH